MTEIKAAHLEKILNRFPVRYVDVQVWQDIYDLVWAQKYN